MEVVCEIRQTLPTRFIHRKILKVLWLFLRTWGEVIDTTSVPFVFAIGALRDPSVEITDLAGETRFRTPYYMSSPDSGSIHDLTLSFLQNFANAQSQAEAFDNNLVNDARSMSQEYADLVSISLRAAVSSLEITLPQNDNGQWNLSDVSI